MEKGMPTFNSIHHVALNVQDLAASERWYADVLGFARLAPFQGDRFERVIMRHPSGVVIGLTRHDDPEAGAPFNERRTGLDHLAFEVSSREELDEWAARFDELGVTHSGVTETPLTGSFLIAFRDPDQLQLEMYMAVGATAR